MDFKDSPQETAFRAEVRAWLEANATPRSETSTSNVEAMLAETGEDAEVVERSRAWQRTLFEGGWAGMTWPKAYGGRDASPIQQFIFADELNAFDVPVNLSLIGIGMIGPTLIAHGTDEQKERYLRPMLSGEEIWCQLWSEPGAGSDVASLRTRAELDPDTGGWVLNGQKVWTSGAHYSRFGLCIARTDPGVPKHRGISCFVIDMEAPGVEVRPLRQMTGGANFNEVFFTDVRIPKENLVGDVNDGWRVAMTTLANERFAAMGSLDTSGLVDPLVALATKTGVADDRVVRQQIADAYVRAKLLVLTGHRALTKISKGSIPGPEGSIAKLVWSDLATDIAALGVGVLGLGGVVTGPDAPDGGMWPGAHLTGPGIHLGGGTDEIMKNIIGERVLGLPKEPAIDRDMPFRELLSSMR